MLPLNKKGKLVGEAVDEQVEQVLDNLEAVLAQADSGLGKVVRLNVYALSHESADRVRELLSQRLEPDVRPAITAVLTSLPHRGAVVAADAVAAAAGKGDAVALERCEAVAGHENCADLAVMPLGGTVYLSGYPEGGGLTTSAVHNSLSALLKTLKHLDLSPAHIARLKVFLTPASSADPVLGELKELFPGQLVPPVVFVEWIASMPIEIELVAQLPNTDSDAGPVQFYNPPEVIPSPVFSRAALVHTDKQIFTSSLSAREDGDFEARGRDVFAQLKTVLTETGSDLRHMAKATYYVTEDETSGVLNKLRPEFFDPRRPPAASKATVHGVWRPNRTLSIDMIAVEAK
jgi:enamine deaminase RidA (YjgF/YER057c/UK114 family)